MVQIPYIKIPSVRVGSIDLTTDIGTGGATPVTPTPITYLTQWKIVGNSEVHGNEIWSCGEYNATDGKYHILVQPQGSSIADISLDAPLRKVNDVADAIEFPSDTDGKALVTRNFGSFDMGNAQYNKTTSSGFSQFYASIYDKASKNNNILCAQYVTGDYQTPNASLVDMHIYSTGANSYIRIRHDELGSLTGEQFAAANSGVEVIYELATPTTELVDAPQIEEADSYTCVISQGGKAVEWSSFETEINSN